MEGEPNIKAFTLTAVEAEILDRSRRLKPAERGKLVSVLRQMTAPTEQRPTEFAGRQADGPGQRGASR